MKLPRGRLLRRRVVSDLAVPLKSVLESELTGYARLESQDALLLNGEGVGVITFEDGIPMVAYHTGTDACGADALGDIAVAGPYRLGLYELTDEVLSEAHQSDDLKISPGLPAQQLAGDPQLCERTKAAAPDSRLQTAAADASRFDAVESFLDDEESIGTLRERAREEAQSRADTWGFEVRDH